MTPRETANQFVQVQVTPQGTADVLMQGMCLKTFGGARAAQAAGDYREHIVQTIEKAILQYHEKKGTYVWPEASTVPEGRVKVSKTTKE